MNRFKQDTVNDLSTVFFNGDEFMETATIGGVGRIPKEYAVVIDNDRLMERKIKDEIENIILSDILFFIKKSDLGYVPKVGNSIVFNNSQYIISSVNNDNGLLEITLIASGG